VTQKKIYPINKGNEEVGSKFIGGYISEAEADLFGLFAIWNNKSRHRLLKELIRLCLRKTPDQNRMLDDLAVRAFKHWSRMAIKGESLSDKQIRFDSFKAEVKKSLERRKLNAVFIDKIMRRIGGIK